jgi:molybdate transport system substrate-binding protein
VKPRVCAAWFAVVAALTACGKAPAGEAPGSRRQVRVAAASDLNVAMGAVSARLASAQRIDVSVSYGSSGTLFSQLLNGAPFDVFLSADIDYPRRLADRGLAADEGVFRYAYGRLVVWTPASSPLDIRGRGLQAVAGPAVQHVSIANPEHAPYGRAAVAALRTAGLYDAVQPKLIYGENVAQALQFVQSGSADVGLVPLSLALAPGAQQSGAWVEVPAEDYPPIEQGGVILRSSRAADAARAFTSFLTGADGRAILEQHGFSVPKR